MRQCQLLRLLRLLRRRVASVYKGDSRAWIYCERYSTVNNTNTNKVQRKQKMKKVSIYTLLVTVTLFIGITVGIWQIKPPKADLNCPAYQQMMYNIGRFAAVPHPAGSKEIEIVRTAILEEIENMGLTPIVQDFEFNFGSIIENHVLMYGYSCYYEWWEDRDEEYFKSMRRILGSGMPEVFDTVYDFFEFLYGIEITEESRTATQNILIEIKSSYTERGIMFVAHYDSGWDTPGAADAMVGVCAILETMRRFADYDGELKNSLYFLLTDAEELGLVGAHAFVEDNPEFADKIDMVVNLEARGNRGGLILFETSPQAYHIMRTIVDSGVRPIGFSFAAKIYKLLGNATDFCVFLNEGYRGINFAVAEGAEHYHQMTDTVGNLCPDSAWQYLQTIFALADYTSVNSLESLRNTSTEAVYFPFLPGNLVLMTIMFSQILCTLAVAAALIWVVFLIRKRQLKTVPSVLTGVFILLSAASAIILPAAGYLFYLPLLAYTITRFIKLFLRNQHAVYVTICSVSGVVVLLLWVPVIYMGIVAFVV